MSANIGSCIKNCRGPANCQIHFAWVGSLLLHMLFKFLSYLMHFIQLCEQCSEMLLWVDEKVGKVGESFPTFIIETPWLKTTFRNKSYDLRYICK